MASGAASRTAQIRRPRRLVRSTSHAPATPSSRHSGMVAAIRSRVFTSSSPTRGRRMRATAVSHPVATVMYTTYPSGTREKRAISTARTYTAETPKGGRGLSPRPAVVVPRLAGADRSVVTELEESGLGHEITDLLGVELGGVNLGCLEVLDGHQLVVGGDVGADCVLEGRAVLEDFLALLAGDELQELLRCGSV